MSKEIKKERYGVSGSPMTTFEKENFEVLCIAALLAKDNYVKILEKAEDAYKKLYEEHPEVIKDSYWKNTFRNISKGVKHHSPDMVEIERSAILHLLISKK